MKRNMGLADRLIRLMIAAVIITLYFANVIMGWWADALLIIAGIAVLTGLASFCPMYSLLGINTCISENPENTE